MLEVSDSRQPPVDQAGGFPSPPSMLWPLTSPQYPERAVTEKELANSAAHVPTLSPDTALPASATICATTFRTGGNSPRRTLTLHMFR